MYAQKMKYFCCLFEFFSPGGQAEGASRGRAQKSVAVWSGRGYTPVNERHWKMVKEGVNDSPRRAALRVLNRVDGGAYADIVLDKELSGLNTADAALATEIVYGVLRWRIRVDRVIESFSARKISRLERSVLNALRIGAYQLLFLEKVPPRAAINESVGLVRAGGPRRAGFVNALLRRIDAKREELPVVSGGNDVERISVECSHPEWLVKRWVERYGVQEAELMCRANLSVPPRTLRVNTLLASREDVISRLEAAGVQARKTRFSPDGIQVAAGRLDARNREFYIQDEASQLVPYLLAPAPGEVVLDACSAPGGKTTHMAALMKNTGRIYAIDKYQGRLRAVSALAQRLGAGIIKPLEADSTVTLPFAVGTKFDAVLCDAPCSGLGVLGRSPDIKYRRTEIDVIENGQRQGALLSNLAHYVKDNGRIVYSVCSFEPEETDMVVLDFLKERKDFVLEGAGGYVPKECGALVDEPGFLRTYPHRHGMDGFFAARLRKAP